MMKLASKEELLRLETLDQYEIFGTAPDPSLDEITALAAMICETPISAISLVGSDTIFFYSRVGPGPARLPRGRRPCETCILGDTVYEIPDARYHKDYRPDGMMVSGRIFRFYAGMPLIAPSGHAIGCLFVQDTMPHTLSDRQKKALVTLSRQVMTRLELNHRTRTMDREGRTRHRVESALTVERNFVSTVLDTVGALVLVYDTAGRLVRFNRACEQVSGYEFTSLLGSYFWEQLIPPDEMFEAVETFDRLRSSEGPASFENSWVTEGGDVRRIAWSANTLVDAQGQASFIIATGIDVTVQREAERTLRESEAQYRELVEGSLGMFCTHDRQGRILSINLHGAESLGRTVEEMTGVRLSEFITKADLPSFRRYLREIADRGEAQGRLCLLHRDGAVRVIAFRNKLIELENREAYVLGFGVDISEQVRAEEKLGALIRQSNSILESVGDGIYGVDLEGRVTVINPAASQMLGYKPTELLGRKLHELVHHTKADGSPYPAEECQINRTLLHLDTVRVSNEVFWRKNGTSFPVEYVARPQIDMTEDQRAIGVVVAFTDTTERRALDLMKDQFISTVSHELRTPLTSLRAALGLVTGGALAQRPEKMRQMLEIAIGNTDRLIRLVNDILDIERIGSGNSELHSVVCSADTLLRRAAGLQQEEAAKQGLHILVQSDGVEVWADPDRVLQALANLISNAIKFSSMDGEIQLSARVLDDQEAQFAIRDNGKGIPADKLERIFERFQQVDASDSRAMGGTGLGLAICRSIIQQHGGRIWAASDEGQGATFYFTLPLRPRQHLS